LQPVRVGCKRTHGLIVVRFFTLIFLVVLGDQLSKIWIINNFHLYDSLVIIPGYLSLTFLRNTGAAFSMLAGHPVWWRQSLFVSIAIIALLVLFLVQRKLGRQNPMYTTSLGLIAGGALGNLIDRLAYGSVVDFLDIYIGRHHWPAFNVADSAITVGVCFFLFTQLTDNDG